MRTLLLTVAIALLFTSTAIAQEPSIPAAAWTRDGMARVLSANADPDTTPALQWGFGYLDLRALGTRWRMAYLPVARPFSGADIGITREWPDPFALTRTDFPMTPRTYRDARHYDPELARIIDSDRARMSLRVGGGH